MANDNIAKAREQTAESGDYPFKERNRKSQESDKPETRLIHYGDDPKWRRYWSIVFRRMR